MLPLSLWTVPTVSDIGITYAIRCAAINQLIQQGTYALINLPP
jgi:hypothetical protein